MNEPVAATRAFLANPGTPLPDRLGGDDAWIDNGWVDVGYIADGVTFSRDPSRDLPLGYLTPRTVTLTLGPCELSEDALAIMGGVSLEAIGTIRHPALYQFAPLKPRRVPPIDQWTTWVRPSTAVPKVGPIYPQRFGNDATKGRLIRTDPHILDNMLFAGTFHNAPYGRLYSRVAASIPDACAHPVIDGNVL